jgi:hypothetical protein
MMAFFLIAGIILFNLILLQLSSNENHEEVVKGRTLYRPWCHFDMETLFLTAEPGSHGLKKVEVVIEVSPKSTIVRELSPMQHAVQSVSVKKEEQKGRKVELKLGQRPELSGSFANTDITGTESVHRRWSVGFRESTQAEANTKRSSTRYKFNPAYGASPSTECFEPGPEVLFDYQTEHCKRLLTVNIEAFWSTVQTPTGKKDRLGPFGILLSLFPNQRKDQGPLLFANFSQDLSFGIDLSKIVSERLTALHDQGEAILDQVKGPDLRQGTTLQLNPNHLEARTKKQHVEFPIEMKRAIHGKIMGKPDDVPFRVANFVESDGRS